MFYKPTFLYVYIVRCSDGNFYTGITSNLRRRIRQHNGMGIPFFWNTKHSYTKSRRPVVLVHFERYGSRKEAWERELVLKKLTHDQKQELINTTTKDQILSAV